MAELDPAFAYTGLQMKICRKVSPRAEDIAMHTLERKDQFPLEIDHMAECVRTGRQPHTGGPEGLQDQKLMDTIYESARTGRAVHLEAVGELDSTRGPAPEES